MILFSKPTLFFGWCFLVLIFTAKAQDHDKPSVAVLTIEVQGISQLEANNLTEYVRSELLETGAVSLLTLDRQNEILDRTGFRNIECSSPECALTIGKILRQSRVIVATCNKLGQVYSLSFRMLDVNTGAVSKSVIREYSGDNNGLITSIRQIVWDLVELMPPPGRFEVHEEQVLDKNRWSWVKANKKILLVGLGVLVLVGSVAVLTSGDVEEIGSPPEFPQ